MPFPTRRQEGEAATVTKRILLVDREPAWLNFGNSVLTEAGYAVTVAQSASESWTFLEKGDQFDLILMELKEVDREKLVFQRVAKAQSERSHLVVVLFPAELIPDKIGAVFKLGAHDCVSKPYESTGLITLVEGQFTESPATILIVEDDEDWCRLLVRYLGEESYKLEVADSFSLATELLRQDSFQVIILDLRLVEEDDENFQGMELLRVLREKDQDVAVIIVSAYGTVEHVREGFKVHNIFAYLGKQSFDPEQYRKVVREAVLQQLKG